MRLAAQMRSVRIPDEAAVGLWQPGEVYVQKAFMVGDDEASALFQSVTIGQLVTSTADGLMATLLPWVIDFEAGSLLGHVARANPQWRTPTIGDAMVLAQGPDGYVSPSWYASKAEHGKAVPTWNYVALQVHGELVVHDDPQWVADVVRRLTDRHEAGRVEPWSVDDAPADYVDAMVRAIVGVEVRIGRIEASVKMSQNKPSADIDGVVAGLTADGNTAVADLVQSSRPD